MRPEWIDFNSHLNLAYYVVLFDLATDALWSAIGLGDRYRAESGCGTFAVEAHTMYLSELVEGDATDARSLVLGVDPKRLHVAHELLCGSTVAARHELMFLNVDLSSRRSTPWPGDTLQGLQAAQRAHAAVARPDWAGRRIAIPVPRPG